MQGQRLPRHAIDLGQRRRPIGELAEEAIQMPRRPFDLDPDAAGAVADEAAQVQAPGQAVDERPKADALNNPLDGDGAAFHDGCPLAGVVA